MIDTRCEQIVTLAEAAAILPRRRGGKKPNIATLYRWTTAGCRGTVLEYVQVGATRCTSREALDRFFQRLTEQARGRQITRASLHTASRRAVAEAERLLDAAGIYGS